MEKTPDPELVRLCAFFDRFGDHGGFKHDEYEKPRCISVEGVWPIEWTKHDNMNYHKSTRRIIWSDVHFKGKNVKSKSS